MSLFPDSSSNARASRVSPEQPASAAQSNIAEYSVSEISGALKRTVEETYGHIRVRGEISGYRGPHSSGHAYFSLKDERSRIEAVIWRGSMSRIKFRPEEGMEVIATGKLTTYPGSSKYQIVIEQMEPAGAGALMALLEERKKKLGAEGLFEASRKQLIPFLPRVIGVVTSPTGAVIRDIIHRITDRFPLHVLVWPVRVQGETSGEEVASAVNGFNTVPFGAGIARPDVIIVARGGGSLEDLWGFNDESVVRAVAASSIPVIAAVGHETDWTLIDLVADVRAPTPTAAAEMAVPVKAELNAQLASLSARLGASMSRLIDQRRQAYRSLQRALPSTDQLLALPRRRFDEATTRLGRGLQSNIIQKRTYFSGLSRQFSPRLLQQQLRERKNLLNVLVARLPRGLAVAIQFHQGLFRQSSIKLVPDLILRRTSQWSAQVSDYQRRCDQSIHVDLERNARRCAELVRLMKTLSHNSVLERGFAIVFDAHGQPVKQAAAIADHDHLSLRFKDGEVGVIATTTLPPATTKRQKPTKIKKPKLESKQGTLF